MKKIFTLAAAVLASFSLWAATESNPTSASKDTDVAGTSYTIPGTYIAGAGSAKTGAMPDKGIKFRLNKPASDLNNAIEFKVNEGYVINAIQLVGVTNSDNKAATVGSIYVDGVAWNGTFNGALPAKNAEAASDIQVSGIAAAQSVVFVFSDLGGASQGNICYTVTYEEAVQKEVDHVDVTLGGVAVNGEALSDTQMATLYGALTLNLAAEYVEAPTVTFTVQTDTYYVGETEPSTKSEKIDVVAALNPDGKWQAQQTVGEKTYTITAVKPATVTITYMDGETVLGKEIVKVGESATKYSEYEVKPLAEFQGWYTDAELTYKADLSATVGADMVLYGKFVKAYAQSIDFEQLVLANGKGANIDSILTARGYEFSNIDQLDSLNNSKGAGRNEPYLGLKIKKQGGYLACNVQPGTTIRIKFGYVAETVLAIAGGDTIELKPTDNKIAALQFPIMVETLVKLQTTSDKTVVIKQIMIDDPLATWMYPITYEAAENGKVEGWTVAYPGEEVVMNITSNEGYTLTSLTYNGTEMVQPAPGAPISFIMPAEAVTVAASFGDIATGIGNADAAVKAVKVIRDGKLFIEKNGVLYNAQGVIVK